jgi:predicted lipoprotein with Yx(FWY)xxD motif
VSKATGERIRVRVRWIACVATFLGMSGVLGFGLPGSAGATSSPSAMKDPGISFSTKSIKGLGEVVVDGQGHTVYVLTGNGKTNLPCTDASGCTKIWPDLPLPDGTKSAKTGSGLKSSLLGTKKLSDGETYPTYNGWLMYEFVGDMAPGTAMGQGVKSFGGYWWALGPNGKPVTKT